MPDTTIWHQTACILCSLNCWIEVRLEDRRLAGIRGDKAHPGSRGYACEKARRLDHYQNGRHRLTSPLRRRPDGSFEPIDWDTAISEIAERFRRIRDTHGGETIFHCGGGGQGHHLGGTYGAAARRALGSVFTSNALAQEKMGEFWVDGQLYGRPRCHTTPDFERAEVTMFVGKNPWQSHGFPTRAHHAPGDRRRPRGRDLARPCRARSAQLGALGGATGLLGRGTGWRGSGDGAGAGARHSRRLTSSPTLHTVSVVDDICLSRRTEARP